MPVSRCLHASLVLAMLAATLPSGCQRTSPAAKPSPRPGARAANGGAPAKPKPAKDGIRFVEGYELALVKARDKGKPLMLFFTADWCRYCHQMAQDAFRQSPVVKLSDRFVCVMIDADHEKELCRQLDVRMFPTVLFLSGDGTPLGRLTGKQPSHKLVIEMQSALQTIARRSDWSPNTFTR